MVCFEDFLDMYKKMHQNDSDYMVNEGKYIYEKSDGCCDFVFGSTNFLNNKEKEKAGARSSSDYDYSFK